MEIAAIIQTWGEHIDAIKDFSNADSPHHNNILIALKNYRKCAEFLRSNIDVLQTWVQNYLASHRHEIFVKYWSNHFQDVAFGDQKLHPRAATDWDIIFGDDKATCFSTALKALDNMKHRQDIKYCDDVTIIAIHEDKPCESNGWYCDLCEMQDHYWKTELQRRLKNAQHPLLNSTISKWFHLTHNKKTPDETWAPPHFYGRVYEDRGANDCYDLAAYLTYLEKTRSTDYKINGHTPRSALNNLNRIALIFGGWDLKHYNKSDDFDIFCLLWNKLDLVLPCIHSDYTQLDVIESMF